MNNEVDFSSEENYKKTFKVFFDKLTESVPQKYKIVGMDITINPNTLHDIFVEYEKKNNKVWLYSAIVCNSDQCKIKLQ